MKLSEHWQSYANYTADFSAAGRTAAFAGIAVCWLLRQDEFVFPRPVLWALGCAIGYLAVDLMQLYVGAFKHHRWLTKAEQDLQRLGPLHDRDIEKPASLDRLARFLFHLKFLALAVGYVLLGYVVMTRVETR